MDIKWEKWTSEKATIFWRLSGLLLLCLLWLRNDSSEAGVILLLFITVMTVTRWRFQLPGWTVLIDQVACMITIVYWPSAVFVLTMPIFESLYNRQPWYSMPTIIFAIIYSDTSLTLVAVFVLSGLSGAILRGWGQETKRYQREADQQRRDRYQLESLKDELLLANVQGTRMAELSERNRIAQQLHDDVGHELTASVLALQAFEQLWKEGDPSAEEMFSQAQQRLANSAVHLRETVHNLKPVKELGLEGFQGISDRFTLCPVNFQVYGDASRVPAQIWNVLYPCLKESLTNIIRHSKPTEVSITLDINPHIVRLSVHNDDAVSLNESQEPGMGLRNIRHRAKAVGGSVSTDTSDGFLFVCVLPLEKK